MWDRVCAGRGRNRESSPVCTNGEFDVPLFRCDIFMERVGAKDAQSDRKVECYGAMKQRNTKG
jgi:hypothetical protein